jgi:predicted RNase H-like nuclease (RuvC/YqgF family)
MQEKEKAARAGMEEARQKISAFEEHSKALEQSLATARGAAEALLARLSAPAAAPDPAAAATMNLEAAATQASDLQAITQSARTALGPMSGPLADTAQAFAGTVPGQLAALHQVAATKATEMAEAQQQAAAAAQSHQAATAAVGPHEQAVARWEAAKINTLVFQKKGELFAVTTKLEELSATLASLESQADSQQDKIAQLQKEKAALEAQAASLQQTIDTETARYLAAKPQ